MEFNPKISIIIPVYNGENYMKEAIESALNQTYNNFEIIVINDGSVDKTEEIALSYGDKIRYFKKENGGQSSALNTGIRNMTGEYFSWLSHDDVYYADKLEAQVSFLNTLADKNVVLYSDFENINSESAFISANRYGDVKPENIRYHMLMATPVNGCTVLVPAGLIKRGFDEKIPMVSDVDLWFYLSGKVPFIHIPKVLHKNRVHFGQMSYRKKKQLLDETNNYLINCLNEITPAEFVRMSGMERETDVYKALIKNFSFRGYYHAANLAFKFYVEECKKSGIIPKVSYLKLNLILNYNYKSAKNFVKLLLYKSHLRR